MRKRISCIAIVGALLLTGCSGKSNEAASTNDSTSTTTTKAPGVEVAATPIAEALKSTLPIAEIQTFTAEDDPNASLGRPGSYSSKVNFHDTRLELVRGSKGEIESESGGSIEVFESSSAAQARATYIKGIAENLGGLLAEYGYVRENVLVRVSGKLTPDKAKEYETALNQLDLEK